MLFLDEAWSLNMCNQIQQHLSEIPPHPRLFNSESGKRCVILIFSYSVVASRQVMKPVNENT